LHIADISESIALDDFWFQKSHLEELSDHLWERMWESVDGTHGKYMLGMVTMLYLRFVSSWNSMKCPNHGI